MGLVKDKPKAADTEETQDTAASSERGTPVEGADHLRIIHDDEAGPESAGVQPNYEVGQTLRVIGGDFKGRMAYIQRVVFASDEDWAQSRTPEHPKRRFAKVAEYIVKTRDGRTDTFAVKPEDIEPLDSTNGWGRGSIPNG